MNRLISVLFIMIINVLHSQEDVYPISLVSQNRDTLWLINNSTGKLIARSWEIGKIPDGEKKPVILFVDNLAEIRSNQDETNKKRRKKK